MPSVQHSLKFCLLFMKFKKNSNITCSNFSAVCSTFCAAQRGFQYTVYGQNILVNFFVKFRKHA